MKDENENREVSLTNVSDVLNYMKSLGNVTVPKLNKVDIRLSDWSEYWLVNFCGNLKMNTLVYYRDVVERHINRVLGGIILTSLCDEDVQLFVNSLYIGVGIKRPLAPKSVKNIHGILHKCLDVAVKHGYISINPSSRIVLPYIPKDKVSAMTNAVLADFMRSIKGKEKEALYLTAIFTGMRESEIIGLTWDCIDFKEGSVHLYRQLVPDRAVHDKRYVFTTLKNNKERLIYPADFVMKLLAKVKESVPNTPEHFVFVSPKTGTHYTIQAVYKSFKRIVKRMGYPDFRVHDLRHTYAVLSLQAGDDIKALQCNMGHYSSSFTLDVYGHYTSDMQKASAAKMTEFVTETFPDLNDWE